MTTRPRRTQQDRVEESSRRLAAAAVALIAEQGYGATTAQQIGLRAGHSRDMVRVRFGTKEALVDSILKTLYEDRLIAPPDDSTCGADMVLQPVRALRDFAIADPILLRAMFMYYADLVANLAFAIRGVSNEEIRTESRLVGRPLADRLQLPQITVEPGNVGALHLTTNAFVGNDLVATNEEVWFLGAPNAFRGDDLPFEGWKQGLIGYTIEARNSSTRLRSQIEYEIFGAPNPVTQMSVRSIIDAIDPVCRAQPGVLIDDATHHVRPDPRLTSI